MLKKKILECFQETRQCRIIKKSHKADVLCSKIKEQKK